MRGPETPDKVRPSARTPAEREEHYRDWRERHDDYLQTVADDDGVSWTTDEDERRWLFFRRYQRPAPPQGLSNNMSVIRREPVTTRPPAAPGADEIRGDHRKWEPATEKRAA